MMCSYEFRLMISVENDDTKALQPWHCILVFTVFFKTRGWWMHFLIKQYASAVSQPAAAPDKRYRSLLCSWVESGNADSHNANEK